MVSAVRRQIIAGSAVMHALIWHEQQMPDLRDPV
jgi:hypothetical protein